MPDIPVTAEHRRKQEAVKCEMDWFDDFPLYIKKGMWEI